MPGAGVPGAGVSGAASVALSTRHTLVIALGLVHDPGLRNCRMQFKSLHSGPLRGIVRLILLLPPW